MSAAKRTIRKIKAAHMLHPNGSLVFCDGCEKIVGSINEFGYRYINLKFICNCGNCGKIEITKKGHSGEPEMAVNKMPRVSRIKLFSCVKCRKPLFSMIDGRTRTYSFYAECMCGKRYDTKPNFDKRLGETLKIYKNQKEHG